VLQRWHQYPHAQFDKKILELEAQAKASKEELDKLLPKIGNIVDDTWVHPTPPRHTCMTVVQPTNI
jgi:hypothetical protein